MYLLFIRAELHRLQRRGPFRGLLMPMDPLLDLLQINWLQVLGATELAQIDQRVRHQFHAIVPLLDTFKSKQEPLEIVLPRKGPLDPHP